MNMKPAVVILGAGGTLGSSLADVLARDFRVIPLSSAQADVTNLASLERTLAESAPDVVVNCAGFLNVDRCEQEPGRSRLVNYVGAVNVGRAVANCQSRRPLLFQFSTDFVFDGLQGNYGETDLAHPLSHYGLHKLLADECLLNAGWPGTYILRVASLVCFPPSKDNFLKRMLFLSGQKPLLEIVDDLRISMTTAEELGRLIARFIDARPAPGLYNGVCSGVTTWYDITRVAFAALGLEYDIRPTSIADRPNAAIRPRLSDLDVSKVTWALGSAPPDWAAALREHLHLHRDQYLACRAAGQEAGLHRAA